MPDKERSTLACCHKRTINVEAFRKKYRFSLLYLLVLLLVAVIASPIGGWGASFTVPADIALRIRLDDTLTSTDSKIGDPFSATVVDQGEYRDARVLRTRQQHRNVGQTEGQHDKDVAFRSTGYAGRAPRPHTR